MRFSRPLAFAALVLFYGSAAHAQTDSGVPLSQLLVKLIQADIFLAPPPAGSTFPSHSAHFVPGVNQEFAPFLFNQSIVSQLSTFPLGSASGGFSYTFDPSLGTFTRSTNSFGPTFAERAVTIGKGKFDVGANYEHAAFDSFEGQDLRNGDVVFYLRHEQATGLFFEGDLIRTNLRLNLRSDTFAFFANYGVTNHFDLGVAVPIVAVKLDAQVDAQVLRLATGAVATTAGIHTFPNGTTAQSFTESGSANGIGDIVLRGKYRITESQGGGIAAALDLRLPTGDYQNLVGSGATQAKAQVIFSRASGMWAPHVNVGYTFSTNGQSPDFNVTDEFNFAGGTEVAVSPRVTVNGDLIGRTLRNAGRLEVGPTTFNYRDVNGVPGSFTATEYQVTGGNLNLIVGAFGVKLNPTANLLLTANVLVPLTKAGIRDRVTPIIGFDYSF